MDHSFHQLKQKDVINIGDGANLGKVCDITVSFPEGNWIGITVTGSRGFKFTNKHELFIPVNFISRIGEDAILVKPEFNRPPCPPPKDKCPPPPCPPSGPRPPKRPSGDFPGADRRDYGEYE